MIRPLLILAGILLSQSAISQTIVPGSIPAEFSVNGGAATYNIPIEVAPGRGGMQPELSLDYSSSGGNGALGVGWSLGGLSAITRCAATYAQDGFKGGIYFNSKDRYCLNGQRLIPISGNNGSVGAQYRTEIDSYAKITSHGGNANNPSYWTVKTKAGQIMTYGGSGNASHSLARGRMTWSIRQIKDTTSNGNPITFDYLIDNKTQYLKSITYSGNRVDIIYQTRPDVREVYVGGTKLRIRNRIKNIDTFAQGTRISRLNMRYQGDKTYSFLQSVQRCDATAARCFKAQTFKVTASPKTFEDFSQWLPSGTGPHTYNYVRGRNQHGVYSDFIDMNGDGLLDRVGHYNYQTKTNGLHVALNTGKGFGEFTLWLPHNQGPHTYNYPRGINGNGVYSDLIDMNGDGLPDRVGHYNYVERKYGVYVALNNGNGFGSFDLWQASGQGQHHENYLTGRNAHGTFSALIDMNGDGLPDRLSHYNYSTKTNGLHVALNTGSGFAPYKLWLAHNKGPHTYNYVIGQNNNGIYSDLVDMNGDGLPDRVGHYNYATRTYGLFVALNTGSGFGAFTMWQPHHQGQHGENYLSGKNAHGSFSQLMDMNGDGLPDRLSHYNYQTKTNGLHVALNTGRGFDAYKLWLPHNQGPHTYNYPQGRNGNGTYSDLLDMNGDGLPDRVGHYNYVTRTRGLHVALNTGVGFGKFELWLDHNQGQHSEDYVQGSNGHGDFSDLLDMDGDGFLDRVGHHDYSTSTPGIRVALSKSNHKTIAAITDEAGNRTDVYYQPLTNKVVYTKGSGAKYPLFDVQSAMNVVRSVRAADGFGGKIAVDYKYKGLKIHAKGRGSYGFSQITAIYPDTGKTLTTDFDQRGFPYTGQVKTVKERYKSKLVNASEYRYKAKKYPKNYWQLNLEFSRDNSYELGSSQYTTRVTTQLQNIDAYGNPRRVIVDTAGNGQTFTKITDSVYTNDTSKWHLGRLTRSIVTHRAPGQTEQKRRVDFKYNAQGLLSEEKLVSAANPANWLTLTQHIYNVHGQKTKVTTRAPNQANRVTSFSYDTKGRLSQTCNVYNECSKNTYDNSSRLASTTGPNGLATRWQYDSVGRMVRENRADGTWTTTEHAFVSNIACRPNGGRLINTAYSCVVTQSKGSPKTVVQLDKFGRTVRTVKQGFDSRLVYSDTQYDRFGRVKQVSRDYYDGEYIYWATSEYDALDRVIRATQPGPHGSETEINTTYNGLRTTTTTNQQSRTKTINALGKTVRVDEPLNIYTEYTYTADGNLKTTRNSGNNGTLITLKYDEFGRKIESKDPSLGTWKYQYNGFGELTKQTNAKNQATTLSYDQLGRMIKRVEPEGTSTWTYSRTNAVKGSRGKLIQEKAPGITRDFSYDSLGRSNSVSTTIVGAGTFTVETTYDSNGRLRRTTYPGNSGFFTENIYNSRGYLTVVRGLRNHAELHDYDQLKPLINKANTAASEYLAKANKLREIGRYYQQQIARYESLKKKSSQRFVTADSALMAKLSDHAKQLNKTVTAGSQLSSDFLGHLNQAIDELHAVNRMIESRYLNYQEIAEQLSVLAAQTLAAADHNFRYQRATTRVASYYNNNNIFNEGSQWLEYWRAADVDASGRISAEVYGNGIVNDYTYSQGTGQLEAINSSLLAVDALRHLEYEYDAFDNVTYRHDLVNDIREDYTYDGLDRLKSTRVKSALYNIQAFNHTQSLNYNKLGNITYKSDVGGYSYANGGSPYRLTKAGNNTYQYDANGNMTKGAGRSFAWTSYNKAKSISQSGRKAEFKYGADRARFQKINHKGDKTYYIGKLYEETRKANGVNEKRHTVYAGGAPIAEHIISSKDGKQTRYLHKDALGSIDLITDAHAEVVDRRSYDAWGKLRDLPWKANASLNDPLYLTQLPFTNKGYTGHEHVQEVDLINMNGRLYDATLGRFVSADPHIQSPELTQNYNRYSYVLNNPMKYTDPSGFFFKKLFRAIKKVFKKVAKVVKQFAGTIAAIALAAVGCIICSSALLNAGLVGAISGAIGAAANGGNVLKAFVSGGLTGFASSFIGGANHIFGKARAFDLGRAVAHGVVGGTVAVINGGKFGAGFLSSAFTKYVSGPIQGFANRVAETTGIASEIVGAVGAALVGGTASVLGGGKFANGAQTAAIQYLFNQVYLESMRRNIVQEANQLTIRAQEIIALEVNHTLSPQIYRDFRRDYLSLMSSIDTYNTSVALERNYTLIQAAPFQAMAAGILAYTGGTAIVSGARNFGSSLHYQALSNPVGFVDDLVGSVLPGVPAQSPAGVVGFGGAYACNKLGISFCQ